MAAQVYEYVQAMSRLCSGFATATTLRGDKVDRIQDVDNVTCHMYTSFSIGENGTLEVETEFRCTYKKLSFKG